MAVSRGRLPRLRRLLGPVDGLVQVRLGPGQLRPLMQAGRQGMAPDDTETYRPLAVEETSTGMTNPTRR